jgi:hypothetical protein
MTTAMRAADFIGTLGVNTHIDFAAYGYQNLSVVESAINYLGLKNLRDSAGSRWRQRPGRSSMPIYRRVRRPTCRHR